MLAERDRQTLAAVGIDNIEQLATAAAAFLRHYPIHAAPALANALSADEEAFLRQGGAVGVGERQPAQSAKAVAELAAEYAQMLASAYTQQQTAELLGVTTSRVRQRMDEHSLYAITGIVGGRVCPRFQFTDHAILPGLDKVLAALSIEAHPIAVQRFFLGVSNDLYSDTLGHTLSPRDWLVTGHSVESLLVLAREL